MIDGYDTTELFDVPLHLVEQEEGIVRIANEYKITPGIVGCL
jgi:hypothetical protein